MTRGRPGGARDDILFRACLDGEEMGEDRFFWADGFRMCAWSCQATDTVSTGWAQVDWADFSRLRRAHWAWASSKYF